MTAQQFFTQSLYQGEHIQLTAVDVDVDPVVEAPWWLDLDYAQLAEGIEPTSKSAAELKKYYREALKEAEEKRESFIFAIRRKGENTLLGMLRIKEVIWVCGAARLVISMPANSAGRPFLPEVINLALRYIFDELSLFRITVDLAEYNPTIKDYEAAGFVREVTFRQYRYRDGHLWNVYLYGMLETEYRARVGGAA